MIEIYIQNIIYMFISGIFIIKFADLFLVIKKNSYKYIFIVLLVLLHLLLLYYEIDVMISWLFISIYFCVAYYGHIFKRLYLGLMAIMLMQLSLDIAFGVVNITDIYLISIPNDYYFYCAYILSILILIFDYFVFKYMQNDYRFSSFKDLFWFLSTCILLNVCGYMIVNFPIAEIELANIYSLIIIGLIEAIFVIFAFLTRRLNKSREELLNQKIESYSQTFNEAMVKNIEETYKANRKLRHDLKNQLLAIEMRIRNGDKEDALDYIHKISNQVINTKVIETNNETLNYIINSKIMTIESYKIQFQYKITNTLSKIDPYDIVIIIGNLLDNAIEAQTYVEEKKSIELNIVDEAGHIVIEVINSYNKNNLIVQEGKLKSTKDDDNEHGFGIDNIKEVINKYNGEYKIDIQEGEFISYIRI